MPTILLVEDDDALAEQLLTSLCSAGYRVIRWERGHAIHPDHPPNVDLVVLDLMLPGLDGFEVLTQLRACSDTPVLILSGRDGSEDKVRALRLGADDYLTKPFWPEEFLERVRARLRRPVLSRQDRVQLGGLTVDLEQRDVQFEGKSIALTPTEYSILTALIRRPGTAVTRRWLMANVLDPDREPSTRTLDVHVSRLRSKLGADLIETVWGVGYRLSKAVCP